MSSLGLNYLSTILAAAAKTAFRCKIEQMTGKILSWEQVGEKLACRGVPAFDHSLHRAARPKRRTHRCG